MNKLLSFTGGKPDFNIDDMLWNDEADRDALNDMFRAYGDNYIIYGVIGATSITAGYVMLDGEVIKVDAHTKSSTHFAKVTTYAAGGDATFNDSVARQTWQQNRATISAGSGSLAYSGAKRMQDVLVDTINAGTSVINTANLPAVATTLTVVEIGDWNMVSTTSVDVTHGLDVTKIVGVADVVIRADIDANRYSLSTYNTSGANVGGGVGIITATQIRLIRITGGLYDAIDYDATSYNRGFIVFITVP